MLSRDPHGAASTGQLIVISGPSGAGKTTVLAAVVRDLPGAAGRQRLGHDPAAAAGRTRRRRLPLSHAERSLPRRRAAGEFLECFEVFRPGDWYGTLESEVAPSLAAGKWVVLEIDVQGAMAVLERYPDAVTIFVQPGSLEELERRLRGRGTESEDVDRSAGWKSPAANWPPPTAISTRSSTTTSTGRSQRNLRDSHEPWRQVDHDRRTARRANRQQGRRSVQAVDADPEAAGGAQRRQPAAGRL